MTKNHEKIIGTYVTYYEIFHDSDFMNAIWKDSDYVTESILDRLLLTSAGYYYEKKYGPALKNRTYYVEITRSTRFWKLFTKFQFKIDILGD